MSDSITPSQPAPATQGKRDIVFLIITAFLMMQPLSTDLYLASLPGLALTFAVPAATVQLTLSMFVVGFGLAQLIVGPLSDKYGRRPVVLAGVAVYVLASLACAAAPGIYGLIAARFAQALGCCTAVVIARAIVRDVYPPEQSVKVIAKASSWLALAPLTGPIIGSYLQVWYGWRAAFIVLSAFACLVWVLVWFKLSETNRQPDPKATAVSGLLRNFKIVLGHRNFWAYAIPGALSYGSIFAFISGSSLVLIKVLNLPTSWFGYCFAFGVSGYLTGTIVCRHLHKSIGDERAFLLGTTVSLSAGLLFLAMVLAGIAHWSMIPPVMFLTMGAHGINFPITQSNAVAPFPQQAGTAAGLLGAFYSAFAFLVGSVVGLSYNGTLYPLAIIAACLGSAIFISTRLLRRQALRPA